MLLADKYTPKHHFVEKERMLFDLSFGLEYFRLLTGNPAVDLRLLTGNPVAFFGSVNSILDAACLQLLTGNPAVDFRLLAVSFGSANWIRKRRRCPMLMTVAAH